MPFTHESRQRVSIAQSLCPANGASPACSASPKLSTIHSNPFTTMSNQPIFPLPPPDIDLAYLLRSDLLLDFEYWSNTDLQLTFGCTVWVRQPLPPRLDHSFGLRPIHEAWSGEELPIELPTLTFEMRHQRFYDVANNLIGGEPHFQLFRVFQYIESTHLSPVQRARKTNLKGHRGAFPRKRLPLSELLAE